MAITLDVVITCKTPRTVHYTLHIGGKAENWRIPPGSTFNHMVLVDGQRYRVETKDVWIPDYTKYKNQQGEMKKVYDWVTATPIAKKAKLQARTAKQRQEAENMPPISNPDLFTW